jgi:hypothetical protein
MPSKIFNAVEHTLFAMAQFPIEAVTENDVKGARRNVEKVRRAMKDTGKSAYELFDELMETVEYVKDSFKTH